MTKKKIKDLGRLDVFSYNGVNWIWLNVIDENGLYKCEPVNSGPALYVGTDNGSMGFEVEVLGRMEFVEKAP